MADQKHEAIAPDKHGDAPVTAVTEKPKKRPAPAEPKQLPPYKVLLHNDNVNDQVHVITSILKVTSLSLADAEARMLEAHNNGVALVLVTHKERAELYQEQFETFNLTVTIEPDA